MVVEAFKVCYVAGKWRAFLVYSNVSIVIMINPANAISRMVVVVTECGKIGYCWNHNHVTSFH